MQRRGGGVRKGLICGSEAKRDDSKQHRIIRGSVNKKDGKIEPH